MPSRRSKLSSAAEGQVKDLSLKLRALLSDKVNQNGATSVSLSKLLDETCNYIKKLQREVDDLSEIIAELVASPDTSSAEADVLRKLLLQQ